MYYRMTRVFTRSQQSSGIPVVAALLAMLVPMLIPPPLAAHGGVVEEDDLCVIKVGYMKAHFKIYVPGETGHTEYCEDIPVRGESVFIMEYLHEGLNESTLDFRIIENVTGKGTFARLQDVRAVDDIDSITVAYQPAAVVPDVYTMLHPFDADGEYIGIVSATGATGEVYTAVFPFEVGYTGLGAWPWIIAGLVFLQLNYWLMSRRRAAAAIALLAVFVASTASAAETVFDSDAGRFRATIASDVRPPPLNRMHAWTLCVTTASGEAVTGAAIAIAGGMPAHDHGLPTAPRVTAELGAGCYRIDGVRFHMSGEWQFTIAIDDGEQRDSVTIPLTIS